jgi:hypothetical protein
MSELNKNHPLGKFPLDSHDTWQFHFYCSDMQRYFTVRYWASSSVKQAWAWTVKVDGSDHRIIAHLHVCEFDSNIYQKTVAKCQSGPEFEFAETSNVSHSGILTVSDKSGGNIIRINYEPQSTHFWHVPGQTEGVFHFPDISAEIEFEGKRHHAFGYCKRYWGNYDGPWGYQFIQGASEDESKFFWTADATFGDDEYNYFKVYERATGTVTSADKLDTWHNNQRGFWRPADKPGMEVELTPVAKMEFFLKSEKQYSKLVERFGKVELRNSDGSSVFTGFGFNEICFGTVG